MDIRPAGHRVPDFCRSPVSFEELRLSRAESIEALEDDFTARYDKGAGHRVPQFMREGAAIVDRCTSLCVRDFPRKCAAILP